MNTKKASSSSSSARKRPNGALGKREAETAVFSWACLLALFFFFLSFFLSFDFLLFFFVLVLCVCVAVDFRIHLRPEQARQGRSKGEKQGAKTHTKACRGLSAGPCVCVRRWWFARQKSLAARSRQRVSGGSVLLRLRELGAKGRRERWEGAMPALAGVAVCAAWLHFARAVPRELASFRCARARVCVCVCVFNVSCVFFSLDVLSQSPGQAAMATPILASLPQQMISAVVASRNGDIDRAELPADAKRYCKLDLKPGCNVRICFTGNGVDDDEVKPWIAHIEDIDWKACLITVSGAQR